MLESKSIGKYEVLEEVGRGGFAVVYKAHDTKMEREIALKIIGGVFVQEPAVIESFQRESRIAADLRHPNIVSIHDFGEADGALYLAMTLIGAGRTLSDLLAEQGPLSLEQALSILTPLADALDYIHRRDPPLTHRDVKPGNVLLEGEGADLWTVLTDFGLTRSLKASTKLTESSTILGTPAYMAPEQCQSKRWGEITPLTDVYSLGVVAYEMLSGHVPFGGQVMAVIHAHAYEPPPSPLKFAPDLGDDLSAVLSRALAKPPAERHSSAGALVKALQQTMAARTATKQQEATLEQLEAKARELLNAGDWLKALDCCTQMMRLDPDRPATLDMLTEAKEGLDRERAEAVRLRRLEEIYAEGVRLLKDGKWKQAVSALKEAVEGNPNFRDAQEHLAQARDELQRAEWYNEAIVHGEAKRWSEACRIWVKVLRGRMDYRDGYGALRLLDATEGLLGQRDMLAETLDQTHEALAHYDALAVAVENDDWARAVELGERLLQLSPDLDHAQAWLTRARGMIEKQAVLRERLIIWEKDGKEMMLVPGGKFICGDEAKEISLPEFWIDRTPVTNVEYARFVAALGREPPQHWEGNIPSKTIADHPVVYVSWRDAAAYAEWAGKQLPTEEQWEKAARGTDGRKYPWGDQEPTSDLCNFDLNEGSTTFVGKYSPQGDSPYGCVDMAGNVWEWTSSDYDLSAKVLRGGGWNNGKRYIRSARRNYYLAPDSEYNNVGFRCVSLQRTTQ
ncbi:MAG: hypothetical protein DRJ03_27970 [Chloroflexi bacterium]|nr:MAG: hypothetical protein DRJ03_27970 [Chloroflexota bacterium]RLC77739.1 MAG: hypothetical protein DRI81_08155 [Chloroflexota bacterium]